MCAPVCVTARCQPHVPRPCRKAEREKKKEDLKEVVAEVQQWEKASSCCWLWAGRWSSRAACSGAVPPHLCCST